MIIIFKQYFYERPEKLLPIIVIILNLKLKKDKSC